MSTSLSVREARAQIVHAAALNSLRITSVELLRPLFASWKPEILNLAIADCVDAGLISEDAHGHFVVEGRS